MAAASPPSIDLSPPSSLDVHSPPIVPSSSPPVAFDVDISDAPSSPSSVPKRVRKRLLETPESRCRSPSSLQEIETKLKEADMRRQQFHEWLVNKARPKVRSPPRSQQPEALADRLQTKLVAAEQKRLELLAQEQTRLAKLEVLRTAARTEVQLRAEREREELESRVESRVQQAETNRQALLEAERQRRAVIHERVAQSVLQRTTQEGKEKERMEALRALIRQKIAAADEKRENLLRAEKTRAQAVVLQARKVAKAVRGKRELELRNKKELLEARLQRAKRRRAEYLEQKGGCQGACHNNGHKMKKYGDQLCRKLTRCWRQFRRSRRTTLMLAQDYAACNISYQSIVSLPFEELAARITSPTTLKSVKALLARIESRFRLPSASGSNVAQIDHLLKRLSPPVRKTTRAGPRGHGPGSGKGPHQSGRITNKDGAKEQNAGKSKIGSSSQKVQDKRTMERYPARVFLCAYMIVSHPEAVFSARGEREETLSEAATKLIPEFETLITTIIDGPPPPSSPSSLDNADAKRMQSPTARPFTVQLSEFDAAWCSYLYQFVAWKVQDAHSLEEDLIRVACQLELSMLQKCNFVSEESAPVSNHDTQAIQKQVLEDQQLLRERILALTGSAGVSRMEAALIDTRNQCSEAREKGSPLPSPFASPQKSKTISPPPPPPMPYADLSGIGQAGVAKVSKSLFSNFNEAQNRTTIGTEDNRRALENESLVNDMLHEPNWNMLELMHGTNKGSDNLNKIQVEIKKTMEDAFWNGVFEGLNRDPPDNNRVVGLLEEMKSELETVVPDAWKQELNECIDVQILSQVLESGSYDYEYFHKLLNYALGIVLRLGAPARDEGAKSSHELLVEELTNSMSELGEQSRSSFTLALVKGLRFVLQQIQVLKADISAARIQALAPVVQGSAGIEYLQKAFLKRYMLTDAQLANVDWASKLPKTVLWLTEVQQTVQQAEEQLEPLRAAYWASSPEGQTARGIPLSMRTGGKVVVGNSTTTAAPTESAASNEYRALKWRSFQTVVRLGIIKLISSVELATEVNVPETLMLNAHRIANAQNEYQRIIVIATGLLLLRQQLIASSVTGAELEHVLNSGQEQLESILQDPNVSIPRIGGLLATLANRSTADPAQDDLMARLLARSLSPEDTVFRCVSTAIQSSIRAIVLLGRGPEGVAMVSNTLQRVGAACLQDSVVNLGARLETLASISSIVHGPWYGAMVGPDN